MKVKDLIKLIEQDGWFQVAQKGSHRQFKNNLVSQPTADSSSPSGCSPFQNATQKNSLTPSAYREFFLGQTIFYFNQFILDIFNFFYKIYYAGLTEVI